VNGDVSQEMADATSLQVVALVRESMDDGDNEALIGLWPSTVEEVDLVLPSLLSLAGVLAERLAQASDGCCGGCVMLSIRESLLACIASQDGEFS